MERLYCLYLILTPLPYTQPALVPSGRFDALVWAAQHLEVADAQTPWMRKTFGAEVAWCRRRWQETHAYPADVERTRLPPYEICQRLSRLAVRRLSRLQLLRSVRLKDAEEIDSLLAHARWYEDFWDNATSATNAHNAIGYRRCALERMREILGPDCFYAGQWPMLLPDGMP